MHRNPWTRRWISALAITGLLSFTISPASAARWGQFTVIGLEQPVLAPTPFTVNAEGPESICSMQFQGRTVKTAPWTFTYDPNRGDDSVSVTYCDGTFDSVYIQADVPWSLSQVLLSREDGSTKTRRISVWSETDETATVKVFYQNREVGQGEASAKTESKIVFEPVSQELVAPYRVEITGNTTSNKMTLNFTVANRWRVLTSSGTSTYRPCSTVYWHYDHSGAPKTVSPANMLSDIKGALTRLSKETGLVFEPVAELPQSPNEMTLEINWKFETEYGSPSAAATGGYSSSGATVIGYVHLNSKNWWTKNDAYKGFAVLKKPRAIAGRGWLLVHEIMHSMGMDHTSARDEIMYPTMSKQNKLGRGDLAGLHYLYKPETCSKN